MKNRYVIGIDLGGTKILAVLFDEKFRVMAEQKAKTRAQKGEKHFLETIQECAEGLLDQANIKRSEVLGVGVGCPGIVQEETGMIVTSPNIGFLERYPLGKRLSKLLKLPVVLGNDVKTGLYGEHQFGAAKGYRHVIGIFLGTGIGGAFILNNQLYVGSGGGAGEIGHTLIDPQGPVCGCGRLGCFEALASRLSIAAEAAALVSRQKAPHLLLEAGTDLSNIKSGALAKAAKAGDTAILDLLRRKSQLIGEVMGSLVNLLNPELIVLGGGLVEAMPTLIVREADQAMRQRALPPLAKQVKVSAAKLGDYSVAMGAAKKAWDLVQMK